MAPSTRSATAMYGHIDPGPEIFFEETHESSDVEMTTEANDGDMNGDDENYYDPVSNAGVERLIVAIDFGTTFSSVAYARLSIGMSPEDVDLDHHVSCIGKFKGFEVPAQGLLELPQAVPSILWYDDGQTKSWRDVLSNRDNYDAQHFDDEDDRDDSSSDDDDSEDQGSHSHFDDRNEIQQSTTERFKASGGTLEDQRWGFDVQRHLSHLELPREEAQPLTKFKLNLVVGAETDEVRTELRPILASLKKKGLIDYDTDIYKHFLSHLLRHTKEQLQQSDQLHEHTVLQFVLCVPAGWPGSACQIMQTALEEAVKDVGLSHNAMNDVCNLFMISEPEAAAECILAEASSEIYSGETVVVLDAGGGTIDAVTYRCVNSRPVRLEAEVVRPASKWCGASFINERFEKKLLQKLDRETYLWNDGINGKSLKSVVQKLTTAFENWEKKLVDVSERDGDNFTVTVEGLREKANKGFFSNNLELRYRTMRKIFRPSLEGARQVLENQLDLAEDQDRLVQKVILTGGFGQSPSLQNHLRAYLAKRASQKGRSAALIIPKSPSTAVARGAVLRALNKRFGPSRILQCSYGFILSEPYEPELVEAHRRTVCRINHTDGERYVDETIRWVLRAGQRVQHMQAFTFDVKHTFPLEEERLICYEQLWMSDTARPDHYRKTHAENKGAVRVGYLEADMTHLKTEGRIQPQSPSEFSTFAGSDETYWEIHYEVRLIVEGRSIRFEARYPVKDNLRPGEDQQRLGMTLVGIAAAFVPGTA